MCSKCDLKVTFWLSVTDHVLGQDSPYSVDVVSNVTAFRAALRAHEHGGDMPDFPVGFKLPEVDRRRMIDLGI